MPTKDIKIYATSVEVSASEQIAAIADHPCVTGPIRIMPDVHAGMGCVIGFTGYFDTGIIPNVVGVDIGCGVSAYMLNIQLDDFIKLLDRKVPKIIDNSNISIIDMLKRVLCFKSRRVESLFNGLDMAIRNQIPTGRSSRNHPSLLLNSIDIKFLDNAKTMLSNIFPDNKFIDPFLQIATLGGGNHFIEIDITDTEHCVLVVHSGSRNLGYKIGNFFQKQANELQQCLKTNQVDKKPVFNNILDLIDVVKSSDLAYLPVVGRNAQIDDLTTFYTAEMYMKYVDLAQQYAKMNRQKIIEEILNILELDVDKTKYIESIHNYIEPISIDQTSKKYLIRKGAIASYKNQLVIIPMTMKDGCLLCLGMNNADWNFSAPHGVGRCYSRNAMRNMLLDNEITMTDFKQSMSDVYTRSVCSETIDESPMAYKDPNVIISKMKDKTIKVLDKLTPIFNLKDI